ILGLEIDTTQLVKRAKKIDASIQRNLLDFDETDEPLKKDEKSLRYIS
nr:hypothetical protein [Candidatus Bathyarchaeota archaeon]